MMEDSRQELYRRTMDAKADIVLKAIGQRILEQENAEFEQIEQEGKDFAVPQQAHEAVAAMISAEKKKTAAKERHKLMRRLGKVCAVVILIVGVSGALLVSHVDAFKYRFDNFLVRVKTEYLELTPDDSDGNTVQNTEIDDKTNLHGVWQPAYLPDGFIVKDFIEEGIMVSILFSNEEEEIINFAQYDANGANLYLDNEAAESGQVELNQKYIGYWTHTDGITSLVWLQNDHIMDISSGISLEELTKIAESVIYKK